MTLVLALLGAIVGAVFGGAIGFFGVIFLGYATGADSQQGAIAMGAATTGLPLGLVIGAILGCVLVLRMRSKAGAPLIGGRQGLIAIGVTAAILIGLYGYFLWEPPKPRFKPPESAPIVLAEIRLPAEMVDLEFLEGRRSFLRTYEDTYYDADVVLTPRREGDTFIIETQHTLLYRREDRGIQVWVRSGRLLIFDLTLAKDPAATDVFSDWIPVDHIRSGFYEEDIPEDEAEGVAIRYQVIRPES